MLTEKAERYKNKICEEIWEKQLKAEEERQYSIKILLCRINQRLEKSHHLSDIITGLMDILTRDEIIAIFDELINNTINHAKRSQKNIIQEIENKRRINKQKMAMLKTESIK